ncbi:hypothetical protein [Photobacterium lutimaris]|uniref:Uncharacterized protein n=1 Tax=Photobacterium lutimaris TaxID=388278 RepID=A0A2T3J4W0_9GAMM|nr:hypothetical protein [Photobacterium lutimaris]PSU36321.1 hypothetical protein C9I99_04820 [Photobacterium lutimaris]
MKNQIRIKTRNTRRTRKIIGVGCGAVVAGLLFAGSVHSAGQWVEVENVHNGRAPLCHHLESGELKFCSDIKLEQEEP